MSKTGRLPICCQGTRTFCISKFSALLVFIFLLVNFSNALIDKQKTAKRIYILLWTPPTRYPFKFWSAGRKDLIRNNCSVTNCYVTKRREHCKGNLGQYDALLFYGRDIVNYKKSDLPKKRLRRQVYIYINGESSENQPVWNPIFDEFFNWTATYKLNSDVVLPYFSIRNEDNEEVGPRTDMTWTNEPSSINRKFRRILQNKSKAVAWFVSHCWTRSKREDYAKVLGKALKRRNLTLDIFGKCGPKKCPLTNRQKCLDLLKKEYYFYLSFENSFSDDYVTEKVVHALVAGAAPVVYGGANYSRFLPPGSYIDARKYTANNLAERISQLIASPAEYQGMFKWRNHYSYQQLYRWDDVCRLCEALNVHMKAGRRKVYRNFRHWWNGEYVESMAKLLYPKLDNPRYGPDYSSNNLF